MNIIGTIMTIIVLGYNPAKTDTTIPMTLDAWDIITCGQATTVGDTLRVYGTSYRVGGSALSKTSFDFRDADIYIKWKIYANSNYLSIKFLAGTYIHSVKYFTTDHTYAGSILVQENTWYYLHFHVNGDSTFSVALCSDNYDDLGGTVVFDTQNVEISPQRKDLITHGKIRSWFGDNYGDSLCYMDIAEVKLSNVNIVNRDSLIMDSVVFDFNDGVFPSAFITDTFSSWSIENYGQDSSGCIYGFIDPDSMAYVKIIRKNVIKISFDVQYITNYSWNPVPGSDFFVDSASYVSFDNSNVMSWKHFEFYTPDDTLTHEFRWRIGPDHYANGNPEFYLDNVKLYTSVLLHAKEGPDKKNAFKVYSLAKGNTIILESPINGNVNVNIYASDGRKIVSRVVELTSGRNMLKLNRSLLPGVYFLKITGKDFQNRTKVIIPGL